MKTAVSDKTGFRQGNLFATGERGVVSVRATGDGKVEFIDFGDQTLAYVASTTGPSAYYPVHPARIERPVKAVLMDLDGTSVHSEPFWIWIIERTTAELLNDDDFRFTDRDHPYVCGHSVGEHLQYCIDTYAPGSSLADARDRYMRIARQEMKEVLEGRGCPDAFVPSPGLKPFLLRLKEEGIKIALVTSGLHEKAWPEIAAAFRTLELGDPLAFYDAVITAGTHPGNGAAGTLGELEAKPHPWLYAEAALVGLGMRFSDRNRIVGIEDSGAGICSIRLAGFPAIGIRGGNIMESGIEPFCTHFCEDLNEAIRTII